jgi:hypothetical protein
VTTSAGDPSGLRAAAITVFCATAGSAAAEVRVTDAGAGRLVIEARRDR